MKINTNQWGYVYKNRNNKYTSRTYLGETFPTREAALKQMELDRPLARKNFKLVRVTLETV